MSEDRRWWRVGCSAWDRVTYVEARNARSAIAALRRDVESAERQNGRSQRETKVWLSVQTFKAEGPLTTLEAFSEDFGWALGEEICRWDSLRRFPGSPATIEDARRGFVAEDRIQSIRRQVAKLYGLPEDQQPISLYPIDGGN